MVSYLAKLIGRIDTGGGVMNSLRVGVFRAEGGAEEQVGEYVRNYSVLYNTFCHFRANGTDYALYSPDYTATRLMALPACRDLGGEEPSSWGFCPVDYYVPAYIDRESIWTDHQGQTHFARTRVNEPEPYLLLPHADEHSSSRPLTPLLYYPFGFVAGCVWGDDTSWKIQYLDLAEVDQGIIRREERFGYVALPEGLRLKQAIDMSDYLYDPNEDDAHQITLAIQRPFDLRTGKML